MSELQAAIEAAGLPAPEYCPKSLISRWPRPKGGFLEILPFKSGWFAQQRPVPLCVTARFYPTAEEAVTQVKEWMDEQ